MTQYDTSTSLDGKGVLPTTVKNFTPARPDGKPSTVEAPARRLTPVTVNSTQGQHRTSESQIERNTTNNSIRYQPLAEAQAMMPVVKWLAAPTGVLAFAASFVHDLHRYVIKVGIPYYPFKAFAVHLMVACSAGLVVGIVSFMIVWRYTSAGLGRTKITEEQKTERQRIKSGERIARARVTAEAQENSLRIQTHEREHMRHIEVLGASMVQRNQPSGNNMLTTYRVQPHVIEAQPDVPLLDPVGAKLLEFTAMCYETNPAGDRLHIDGQGYVRKGVSIPWAQRGVFTRSETRAALDILAWIAPQLWRYDEAKKMWQLNLASYPSTNAALAAINTVPTRQI